MFVLPRAASTATRCFYITVEEFWLTSFAGLLKFSQIGFEAWTAIASQKDSNQNFPLILFHKFTGPYWDHQYIFGNSSDKPVCYWSTVIFWVSGL